MTQVHRQDRHDRQIQDAARQDAHRRGTNRALLVGGTIAIAALLGVTGCEMGADMGDDEVEVGEVERREIPRRGRLGARANPAGIEAPGPQGLANQHAALDSAITTRNVDQLSRAWHIDTGENVSHTPIVRDGRVYFADWGGTVYAADAATGRILWRAKVERPRRQWPWHGFAGTGTLGEGMLFEAGVEGNIFALDAETGQVVWQRAFTEDPQAGNCGDLLYYDGLVYVPVSSVEEMLDALQEGFEPDFQGEVIALDARTGETVWTRPLAEPPTTGVAVWSSFALDPELDTLFITTSNNYTVPANELSDALVAVDAKTGRIKWFDQVTEQDIWTMENPIGPDYAFAAGPQLFEAVIDGERRALVGAGQKSGVFYVWDRATGERVWTVTVGYGQVGGGIHAEASIGEDTLYIWGNNAYPYQNPQQYPMDIKAVDAATGNYRWVRPKAQPALLVSAGVLANDIYFVGSLDGRVRGYAADDGQRVWVSPDTGPVASSLVAAGDALMFGTGVPQRFGGGEGQKGVWAFSLGREAAPTAAAR